MTFPIYALCVIYLNQEKRATEKERKKKVETANQEIVKLTDELSRESEGSKRFLELHEEINEHRQEQSRLEERPNFFTVKGAILIQVVLLLIALASSLIGIFYFYENDEMNVFLSISLSTVLSFLAIAGLYRTIYNVEHAAPRGAVEVEVISQFKETRTSTLEVKAGEEIDITLGIRSPDNDLKMANYNVFFPPGIKVKNTSAEGSELQPKKGLYFPNYTKVFFSEASAPKNLFQTATCKILAKRVGEYKILVKVNAKGIEESTSELTLKAVK